MWGTILNEWDNGSFKFPKIVGRFEWNTSVLETPQSPFIQSFLVNKELPKKQNYSAFQKYIDSSQNKYATSFPSLSGDILVIPMPVRGKNYATLKDFIDNAPKIQQKEFWKKVSNVARTCMRKERIWISVHGMGVPYTHVRIATSPKYYFDQKLI